MAKFKYKMQNVLDIKLKLEDAAKMEFGQATAKVVEEEEILKAIERRKREYEAEGVALRKNKLHVMDIKTNNEAVAILKGEVAAQEKQVELAKREQEKARVRLQNAMQERKTQEKLYENAFEAFVQEINAQESKEVDELTSYTYGKKQTEGRITTSGTKNG